GSQVLRNGIESLAGLGEYSIRVFQLDDLTSIDEGQFSSCYRLVLLPIAASLPIEQRESRAIERLSKSGFKVICCVDNLEQMLLSEKCRLLLAGTLSILDSA